MKRDPLLTKKKPHRAYNGDNPTIMAIESVVEHPRSSLHQRASQLNVSDICSYYQQFIKRRKIIYIYRS